jgi:hypothetical protein
MPDRSDPFNHIRARQHLEEVNEWILGGQGEIMEVSGKLSLVWTDPVVDEQRYLAIKPAGEQDILINGRRYPATEEALKQALIYHLRALKGHKK